MEDDDKSKDKSKKKRSDRVHAVGEDEEEGEMKELKGMMV